MASRTTFNDLTTPPLPGGGSSGLVKQYSDRIKTLFDASALPLTAVGGTANAVTATLDPPLDGGGLVDGMKFEITWGAANNAGVTLALNGGSAVAVLDAAGTALIAGSVGAGLRSFLEYIGGSFRILSPLLTSGGGASRYFWQFTASDTWLKPSGLDDDTMVMIEAWAGGGGGSSATSGGGGGGGGYIRRWLRLGALPSSVTVTVGAGGAVNTNGQNSTFGSFLTAYQGVAGSGTDGGRGGGGTTNGRLGSGNAGVGSAGTAGGDATMETGGGGGGSAATSGNTAGGSGGAALRGGGGGGGSRNASGALGQGGPSVFGGDGGAQDLPGVAPAGGGGRNAAGARGEVRVWI